MVPESAMLVQKAGLANMTARQVLQRALERRRSFTGRIISIILFVVISALLGWTSGYAYRAWINPPFVGAITQTVPKMPTVEDQWIYACFVNTPEAWQAVIDHFPEETYYWGNKAKRQMIRYYYLIDDRHNSLPLFNEFSQLSDFYIDEQMLGLAGLTWCTADEPDMLIPQGYLEQIRWISYPNSDELYWQILDAATKRLQERKAESVPATTEPQS